MADKKITLILLFAFSFLVYAACERYENCAPKVCDPFSKECVDCNFFIKQCPGFCNTTSGMCQPCTKNEDCEYDEFCSNGNCIKLSNVYSCGYPKNHQWISYECCAGENGWYKYCPSGKVCVFHQCKDLCSFGMKAQGGTCKPDYLLNLSNIMIVIFFGISGIIFMVGSAFASTAVTEYGKRLFKITLENLFIVFIIVVLIYWLNEIVTPVISQTKLAYPGESVNRNLGNWTSLQNYVENYLLDIKNRLKDGTNAILNIAIFGGIIGSLQVSVSLESLIGVSGNILIPIGSGFSSLINFISYGVTFLGAALLNIELQYQIFKYIGRTAFPVLLPLGILFRTFPITRDAGSAIIAIAIGFGIFLPIFYIINRDVSEKVCGTGGFEPSEIVTELSGKITEAGELIDYIRARLAPDQFFGKLLCIFGIEAVILPFFSYVLTLNLIRHLAEIMGTHIDLSTLVKII